MENVEEVLLELNSYENKVQPESVSPVLDEYLVHVAKTGSTLFPWEKIKPLFKKKLETVINELAPSGDSEQFPVVPNVDQFSLVASKEKVFSQLEHFNGIPFTIQRLCELLTQPKKHYKRTDKYMRALEKNMLVVSTIDMNNKKRDEREESEEDKENDMNGSTISGKDNGYRHRSAFSMRRSCGEPDEDEEFKNNSKDESDEMKGEPEKKMARLSDELLKKKQVEKNEEDEMEVEEEEEEEGNNKANNSDSELMDIQQQSDKSNEKTESVEEIKSETSSMSETSSNSSTNDDIANDTGTQTSSTPLKVEEERKSSEETQSEEDLQQPQLAKDSAEVPEKMEEEGDNEPKQSEAAETGPCDSAVSADDDSKVSPDVSGSGDITSATLVQTPAPTSSSPNLNTDEKEEKKEEESEEKKSQVSESSSSSTSQQQISSTSTSDQKEGQQECDQLVVQSCDQAGEQRLASDEDDKKSIPVEKESAEERKGPCDSGEKVSEKSENSSEKVESSSSIENEEKKIIPTEVNKNEDETKV